MIKKNILIEGWRYINHSYALVNQYQLLNAPPLANFYHRDIKHHYDHWTRQNNPSGFSEEMIKNLEAIPTSYDLDDIDVIYRIFSPFDFTPVKNKKVFVFCPSEHLVIKDHFFSNNLREILDEKIDFICPSRWSAQAFLNRGIPESRIHVIPHAFDRNLFYKFEDEHSKEYRDKFKYKPDDFLLFNINSFHHNKSPDLIFRVFFDLHKKYPKIKLLIKDQSALYKINGVEYLKKYIAQRNIGYERSAIDSIKFISGTLPFQFLNILYNMSDCYLSPYRAEGFNLPPLEAAATGAQVVLTAGGATAEYARDINAIEIAGEMKMLDKVGYYIEPDYDDLYANLENIYLLSRHRRERKDPSQFIDKFSWIQKSVEWTNVLTS
jgi:glycosyltransferase involved in cell wall biosynthesis